MSFSLNIETTIDQPIDLVFDRLINISDYANWLPQAGIFVSTRQTSDDPVQVGTTYTDKTTVGTFHGEIIEFERPTSVVFQHRLRWLGIPVMETQPGYVLESQNGSTKLHHIAAGQLFGIFKLMRPKVARMARQERQRTVDALKKSLEAP